MKKEQLLLNFSFASIVIFIATILILGFFTPNYSHLRNTISQLVLGKYGWIQELNFIQFSLGIASFGYIFYRNLTKESSKKVWGNILVFNLLFLITVILFPTELNLHEKLFENKLSLSGKVHFGALITYFLLAPFGIYSLAKMLKDEPELSALASFTSKVGYGLSLLCYIWTYLFLTGQFTNYLGIFQKIIAGITLYWFLRILVLLKKITDQ